MSAVLTRCRVSSEQIDLLLSFMEEHRDFAAGKQSIYSRYSSSKLWRLLAERLNVAAAASEGVRKSPDKWCKYWADLKYKARKKLSVGSAELSSVEERLQNILYPKNYQANCRDQIGSHSDDEMYSDASGGVMASGAGGGGTAGGGAAAEGGVRVSTEELLAEAAMRSALAAEKQAETAAQAVDVLRELLALLRARLPQPPPAAPPPHAAPAPHPLDHHMQHHHHRL